MLKIIFDESLVFPKGGVPRDNAFSCENHHHDDHRLHTYFLLYSHLNDLLRRAERTQSFFTPF